MIARASLIVGMAIAAGGCLPVCYAGAAATDHSKKVTTQPADKHQVEHQQQQN